MYRIVQLWIDIYVVHLCFVQNDVLPQVTPDFASDGIPGCDATLCAEIDRVTSCSAAGLIALQTQTYSVHMCFGGVHTLP